MCCFVWPHAAGPDGGPPKKSPTPGVILIQPAPLTQCVPGTCFRQDMCIPSELEGFQCAPCPDGYTGDGIHCDDVDEVGIMCSWVYMCLCSHLLKVALVSIQPSFFGFSASLTHVSLVSAVWTLLLVFAVGNALWDTQVQN